MPNAQIVSPPFPIGLSWLINCLLELGVRATMYSTSWIDGPEGSRMVPEYIREKMRWQLPILARAAGLVQFRDDEPIQEVEWSHRLTYAQYPARKTILCVRDPRDAAYSQFRRLVKDGTYQDSEAELLAFLTRPEIHMEHFPHLFDLPPADTLAYYYLLCLELVPPEQLLVLRFEDRKADPVRELRRVLDFLGLARSESEISHALANSDIQQALALQQSRDVGTHPQALRARAGKIGEWKDVLSPAALACFRGPAEKAMARLGYEPLPDGTPPARGSGLRPGRAAEATAMFIRYHQLLGQGQQAQAAGLMRQMLQASSRDPGLRSHLSGQMLGLLWTRAIMGMSGSHLPVAARMAQFFFASNAEFAAWPPLQQVAAQIANPHHALHTLSHERLFRSPEADVQNPAKLIYFHPELRSEADFSRAARLAIDSGLRYFLWQREGVLLDGRGLLQLCDLLRPLPHAEAAVPVFQTAASANFAFEAYQLHARLGAELSPLRLNALPDCVLFQTGALASLPLEQPAASWIGALCAYRALGVLAWGPTA